MSAEPSQLTREVLEHTYLAEQLDALHSSLTTLLELVKEGEIELILDQPKKSQSQKTLFIKKVLSQLPSDKLREVLQKAWTEGSYDLFESHSLENLLKKLQKEAEAVEVAKLSIAVKAKDADLREFAELLSAKTGHRVALEVTVSKALIGGAVIQFGSYISDYSLKARLDQFRAHWRKATTEQTA